MLKAARACDVAAQRAADEVHALARFMDQLEASGGWADGEAADARMALADAARALTRTLDELRALSGDVARTANRYRSSRG
jgi:hypothetical protein